MTITFRDAERSGAHVLLGLAGPTGTGKTLSALLLAKGMCPDESKIYFIDTERKRAGHYAYAAGEPEAEFKFRFKHGLLDAPFSPQRYREALAVAVKAGAEVIIIDSASHEHEGPGGILEMHTTEHKKTNFREATKFAAWIRPKAEHNLYVNELLQVEAHIIFCFRAKDKLAMVKNDKGKMEPVNVGWTPICPDRLEYEMADLLILPPGANGIPDLTEKATKLNEHHRHIFGEGRQLCEAQGAALAQWAAGGGAEQQRDTTPSPETSLAEEVKSQESKDYYLPAFAAVDTVDGLKEIGAEYAADKGGILSGDADEIEAAYRERLTELRETASA